MTTAATEKRAEWLVPLVVATGLLIELMDSSALAISLPTIARDFQIDPVHLRLALTAYVMTVAILVCASAWLANRFGARRIFVIAIVVFVTGSICCGLSSSVFELAAARVLQGTGGAMMTPVGRSIVVAAVPRAGLGKAMGWFTTPAIIGPMLGPPLAGLLIETASWRWIFFINIPIGIVGIFAVLRYVPVIATHRTQFDGRGFAIVSVAIAALILPVEAGEMLDASARWSLAALGGIAMWVYVRYSRRVEHPVLDLRLLRHATLRTSLLAGSLTRISVGAMPFLLPLMLQVALGLSPLITSYVTIAMALGTMSARFTSPPIMRAAGFTRGMMILAGITAVLSLLPAFFQIATPLVLIAVTMCLISATRASLLLSGMSLAYAEVSQREIGQATVLMAVGQQLSLGAGISLAGWLLQISSGGQALQSSDFTLPFIALAVLMALAIPVIARMPHEAAAALSDQDSRTS